MRASDVQQSRFAQMSDAIIGRNILFAVLLIYILRVCMAMYRGVWVALWSP